MSFFPGKAVLVIALLFLFTPPVLALLPPGDITVHSDPSGAFACIDNTDCDYTTATFTAAADAWHTVTVTKDGYLRWSDTVYVTSAQTSVIVANLQLNPDATKIQVYVNPGGGQVCLDNSQCHVDVGTQAGIGSTQFTGVSTGYHTITVETDGFQLYSEQVYVSLGATSTIHIDLVPITTPTGSIQVISTPSGAQACVDGGNCLQTPGTFSGLSSGTYHPLVVSLPGYLSYYENSYVVVGETTVVRANLKPSAPPTGAIRVYVNLIGSTVCLDNGICRDDVGGTSGAGTGTGTTEFTGVAANTVHTIRVAATGYEQFSTDLTVRQDEINTVDVVMEPLRSATTSPVPSMTTIPTPTSLPSTRAGLGSMPVIGAIVLCGAILLVRKGSG